MVPAQGQDPRALSDQSSGLVLDDLYRPLGVVRGHAEIAAIDDLLVTERIDVVELVVQVQLARVLANVRRSEPRARTGAGPGIEGDSDDRDVRVLDVLDPGQHREGGNARVARKVRVVAVR